MTGHDDTMETRAPTRAELELLTRMLVGSGVEGVVELLVQLRHARVSADSSPTRLQFVVPEDAPRSRFGTGRAVLPGTFATFDEQDEPVGELRLLVRDGVLRVLEYTWYTESPPTAMPPADWLAIDPAPAAAAPVGALPEQPARAPRVTRAGAAGRPRRGAGRGTRKPATRPAARRERLAGARTRSVAAPISREPRGRRVASGARWLAPVLVTIGLLVGSTAGMALGSSHGADVDAARAAGARSGALDGTRAGAPAGAAVGSAAGTAAGRERGYRTSYDTAFGAARAKARRSAFQATRAAARRQRAAAQAAAAAAASREAACAGYGAVPGYDRCGRLIL